MISLECWGSFCHTNVWYASPKSSRFIFYKDDIYSCNGNGTVGTRHGPFNGELNGPFNGELNGLFNCELNGPFNGELNGPFNGELNGLFNGELNGPFSS